MEEVVEAEFTSIATTTSPLTALDFLDIQEDVYEVDPSQVDASLASGNRFPALSVATGTSKSALVRENRVAIGTFILGGKMPRPVTTTPDEPAKFIIGAIRYMRLRTVPSDASEDAGKVLCAAMMQDGKFKAIRGAGIAHPDDKMNHIFARTTKTKRRNEDIIEFAGWSFPDGAEDTRDCSKCLYGPGRCAKNNRGFIGKGETVYELVGDEVRPLDSSIKIDDAFRKPAKTDCSLVIRAFGHVYCPAFDGLPEAYVPCQVTFRNSGFAGGQSLLNRVNTWMKAPKPKAPYAHPVLIQTTAQMGPGEKPYRRMEDGGVLKVVIQKQVEGATPIGDGRFEIAFPTTGPKQAAALRAAGRPAQDMIGETKALLDSLTEEDWIGFLDEDALNYGEEPAPTGDAAHMPDLPY